MILLKTDREISLMKDAGKIAALALLRAGEMIKEGISTKEIDESVRKFIEKQGASPSFLGYGGFPASTCISLNNVVVHGIPSRDCIIKNGDIVSVDVGAYYKGFHGDTAYTFSCGEIGENAKALLEATRESLYKAIEQALPGNRIGDIGNTVEEYVKVRGYSVVRDFVGHGVGADMHEDPSVPNFGSPHRGTRLMSGMTIAIEPMVNEGSSAVRVLDDGWTTVTADKKLSAHFEHNIAITDSGPVILTLPE